MPSYVYVHNTSEQHHPGKRNNTITIVDIDMAWWMILFDQPGVQGISQLSGDGLVPQFWFVRLKRYCKLC
jgi:hypothetical protein